MGRTIDADALRARMYHESFETDSDMQKWDSGCWIRYKLFEKCLEEQPTVQPQRMRGRWMESDTDGFVCSVCRNGYKMQPTIMGEPMFEFCPCCGADMRETE